MADTLDLPEVKPRGVFTEEGPTTPYGAFAGDLLGAPPTRDFAAERADLMPRRAAAEAKRQSSVGAVTAELDKTTDEQTADAAARAAERKTGRATLDATKPSAEKPDITARPFLAPGAGVLNQLHAALISVGALATQIGGLSGSAMPAMLAMRGLAEGYAKGDRERIDHEWAAWKASNEELLAKHRAAVETYRDLVEDQKLSAAEKQLLASTRLKGLEWTAAQHALAAQDIEGQLKELAAAEDRERKHTETMKKLDEQIANHGAQQKRLDAALDETRLFHRNMEKQRATEADERARQRDRDLDLKQQGLDLRERLGSDKLKEREAGYTTMSGVLTDMDGLVDRLDKKGLLPKGTGLLASGAGWANRKMDPNDEDWRQWMALQGAMVGYERTVYNDKGARALATYKSLLDFVENPPTAQGAHDVIKRMRGYLVASAPGAAPKGETRTAPTLPKGAHMEGDDIVSDSGVYVWRGGQWQRR